MAYVLSNAVGFLLLWGLFYLTGGPLARLCRQDSDGFWHGLLTRMTLGTAAWMVLVFVLCSLRWLYTGPIYAAIGLVLAISALAARRKLSGSGLGKLQVLGARLRTWWRGLSWPEAVLYSSLATSLAALFVLSMSPVPAWDAETYHLTLPKLYIQNHGFFRIPFNLFSNWPMYVDLLYLLAMLLKDYIQASMIHFGFGLLCIVAMARLCKIGNSPPAGLVAAALFLNNEVVLFELGTAYVDIAFTFFFLMAFLFAVSALDRDSTPHLLMSGVCCGILGGSKLTGGLGLLCVAGLVLPHAVRRGGMRALARSAAALGLPFLLLALPWFVKAYLATGNPVYPFLYSRFGGPEWNLTLTQQMAEWNERIGMGKSALDFALLPLRVILEGGLGYARFDGSIHRGWIVVLPLALLLGLREPVSRRCLGVALLYFAGWSLSSQQMRLLIPILPLLSVAGAIAIHRGVERLGGQRLGGGLRACVSLAAAACLLMGSWTGLQEGTRLLGTMLVHGQGIKHLGAKPVYHFINRQLPGTAKILFLNTNHGFFCDRDYISDSAFEASQMQALLAQARTEEELRRLLGELRITHILYRKWNWGIHYPAPFWRLINGKRHARLIYTSPDRTDLLFELTAPAASPGEAGTPVPRRN